MNTITEGRFEDTNKAFETPDVKSVDYIVDSFRPQEELKLEPILEKAFRKWQN